MQRSIISFGSIIVLGLIVLFGNSLVSLVLGKMSVDLTDEGLYTLSQGSRNVVKKLDTPVTLKLYISRTDGAKYPVVKIYGDRVQHLLREYQRASKGKIHIEVYDPRPDSEEESWAQKYGLTPLALPNGDRIFFGLAAVSATGKEESIPVVDLNRQEYLEYDITRLLFTLATTEKLGIGVISSLKIQGDTQARMPGMMQQEQQDPWVMVSQISNLGDVKFIDNGVSEIDPGIKVLMVIHPKGLTPSTLYAIDQFVMRGGNLFVAIDPYNNADQPQDPSNPQAAMFADRSSNLKEILSAWGVEMIEKKAVGDLALATKVAVSQTSPPEDFLLWLSLTRAGSNKVDVINSKDMATSKLENILLPWAGALKITPVEGVTVEPLLRSTSQSQLFEESDYRYGGGSPDNIRTKFMPGNESYVLAARISGKLKSSQKSKPEGLTGAAATAEQKMQATETGYVVVVADADFLTDMASARAQNLFGTKLVSLLNDNLPFLGNTIENLLGSNDLISLRSRGQFARPFTKVEEIEKNAAERWRKEELTFQSALNAANSRLSELQEGTKPGTEQVMNKAILDEVKKLRDERQQAQERLREVRRNLRQDKESLGGWLFVINTFLVPLILILGVIFTPRKRKKATA